MRLIHRAHLVVIMSCHVIHVVLTSLSCVTKFFYHTFFFILWSDCLSSCRNFKSSLILIITSYLPSYIVISKFFFLKYYYHHSCCSALLHNTRGVMRLLCSCCRFTSLCAVMKLRIKKILTDFCDTRTHFAALVRACFHESHTWDKSVM
jgi:hypothetical protein